jgi:hypothetical protein
VLSALPPKNFSGLAKREHFSMVSPFHATTILVLVAFEGLDDAVAVPQAIFRPPGHEVQICFGVSVRGSGAMSARVAAEGPAALTRLS